MLNKIPIRFRLTILCVLLLTLCSVGLTATLNFSANHMADMIEALPLTPAISIGEPIPLKGDMVAGQILPAGSSVPSHEARKAFLNQSILYMLFVVIAGGGLTYVIVGRALKPLNELSSQMKNRTAHNLSDDLEVPQSHDEIADLTLAFNEMSNKLDNTFAMQRRFSSSAAHELRTPLTVLKTKVDVFKKKKSHTTEEYDNLLSVITNHTNRLSDLVKNLLDLTNMEALECDQRVAVKSLFMDILDELSLLAKEKKVSLYLTGEKRNVQGNESLLHRAFYNLIENAIKYNTENGSVVAAISVKGEHTIITISDTGIGISPEQRELIFEPFYRVDKSRSRQMGGAGLGLSIVKSIIDKHGGKIVVSENPVGGSQFSIIL